MTRNFLLSVGVVLAIVCMKPTIGICGVLPETQSLEAIGTVVAYDQLNALTNITWVSQSQILLVRIEKRIKGREAGRFIKVVYKYAPNESPLPQNIFEGNSQWRFSLKRDVGCDSTLGEMKAKKPQTREDEIKVLRLKFISQTDILDDKVMLPCYVLKPGRYRMQK